jgi:hypothetical protein
MKNPISRVLAAMSVICLGIAAASVALLLSGKGVPSVASKATSISEQVDGTLKNIEGGKDVPSVASNETSISEQADGTLKNIEGGKDVPSVAPKKASISEEVDGIFQNIDERTAASRQLDGKYLVDGIPLAFHSGPYSYIENNPEYDAIVSQGVSILGELVELQNNSKKYDPFKRYLIALAIEDITKTSLKKHTEYYWAEASAFSAQWTKLKADAQTEIPNAITDEALTDDERFLKISKFGMLAIPYLEEAIETVKTSTASDTDHFTSDGRASIANDKQMTALKAMKNILETGDRDSVLKLASDQIQFSAVTSLLP